MTQLIFVILSLFPAAAFAAHSNVHIVFCEVVSFDKKEVKAKCDSTRPKQISKIPREWIEEGGQKMRVGSQLHIPLDDKKFAQMGAAK